jgi:hypothetical protein
MGARRLMRDGLCTLSMSGRLTGSEVAAGVAYRTLVAEVASRNRPIQPVAARLLLVTPWDERMHTAADQVRRIDEQVEKRFGPDGLLVLHAVIRDGRSIGSWATGSKRRERLAVIAKTVLLYIADVRRGVA